ncbi:13626_t:CDS:2 [Ambispora leptoticha]|uniref:13626_t:CDS:1 n=1 Tax=Ambispora leptoticha TaxID=144679 RepID=A0A9N9G203_9GLOM|nr:13626_t:CDS:2 [Ambispora leptoticha]
METTKHKQPIRSNSTNEVEDAKILYHDIHDYLETLTNLIKSVAEEEEELPTSAANFLSEYESYLADCSAHQDIITNIPTTSTKIQSSEWHRSYLSSKSSLLSPPQPRRSHSAPAVFQMKDATKLIQLARIEPTKTTIERVRASAIFSSITSGVSDKNNDQASSITTPSIRNLNKALFGTTDQKEIALIKQKMQAKPLVSFPTWWFTNEKSSKKVFAHFTAWFFATDDDEPTEIENVTESRTETDSQPPITTTATQPRIQSSATNESQVIQSTLSRTFGTLFSSNKKQKIDENSKVNLEKLITFPTPIFDDKFDFIANIISFTKNAAMRIDRWDRYNEPIM